MTATACRCGVVRDARGLCRHCDAPVSCGITCAACRTRDAHCTVCATYCGTRAAAEYHDKACRARETRRTA